MTDADRAAVPPTALDKVWGAAVVVVATVLVSVLEVFFVPFTVGAHHVPVTLVLLLVTSPLLAALGRWALVHPLGCILPLPFWFVVSVLGSYKTPTGDLLIAAGNWVAGVYFYGGLVVWLASIVLVVRGELFGAPPAREVHR